MLLIRISFVFLYLVVFFGQFNESDSRLFENFFIGSQPKCEARCNNKHGYFVDKSGDVKPVTRSSIRFKIKCSCTPSKAFRALVREKYGKRKAYMQLAWSIIGRGKRSRRKLTEIKFLTADEVAKNPGSKSLGLSRSASGTGVDKTATLAHKNIITATGLTEEEVQADLERQKAKIRAAHPDSIITFKTLSPEEIKGLQGNG